jgi:hypothetical protein
MYTTVFIDGGKGVSNLQTSQGSIPDGLETAFATVSGSTT